MHTRVYVYIHVCMRICIYTYSVYMHAYMYTRIHVCMYACLYVHMYTYTHACMRICIHIYLSGTLRTSCQHRAFSGVVATGA